MDETIRKNKNYFLIYAIGLSLFVFFIVLVRAATTAITWDEAFTYIAYAKNFHINQLIDIHSNYANNHILNTLMIFVVNKLCGLQYNELVIRLPNIIMLIFYFIGSYIFAKDEKNKYLLFSGLILNYYVMEFFGLARGYGIATCIIIWMYYFFKKAIKQNYDDKNILLSCLFGLIACYANTVSILALGTICSVYFIELIRKKKVVKFVKRNILKIIPLIIFFIYIVIFHFIVTGADKPVFGEVEGATIIGFFKHNFIWMFIQNETVNIILSITILITIILCIILFRKKMEEMPFFVSLFILLLYLILPSIILQKPFLIERCLVPLWPLFIAGVVEIFNLLTQKVPNNIVKLLTATCTLLLLFMFCIRINIRETRDWKDNYKVRDIVHSALYNHRTLTKEEYDEIRKIYGITFYREKILEQYEFDIIPKE